MNYSFEFITPCLKIKGQPQSWKCKGCDHILNDVSHWRGKKKEFCTPNCRSKHYRKIKKLLQPDLITKRISTIPPS
jgi:hypothetical protein